MCGCNERAEGEIWTELKEQPLVYCISSNVEETHPTIINIEIKETRTREGEKERNEKRMCATVIPIYASDNVFVGGKTKEGRNGCNAVYLPGP